MANPFHFIGLSNTLSQPTKLERACSLYKRSGDSKRMTDKPEETIGDCPDCGAAVGGGRTACLKLFEEVLAKEFTDYTYAKDHRLTVDSYALQHPDKYMKSAKSFAAHLTGMYAALRLRDKPSIDRCVQQWLSKPVRLDRPEAPAPKQRGLLTIRYLHEAESPEQHLARVREWAESIWTAWDELEGLAKDWVNEARNGFAS